MKQLKPILDFIVALILGALFLLAATGIVTAIYYLFTNL